MNLTARQRDVLHSLWLQRDTDMGGGPTYGKNGWVTPMFVGGFNGSHHSRTLLQLWKLGLADRVKCCRGHGVRENKSCRCKGSCRYRINKRGIGRLNLELAAQVAAEETKAARR